MKARFRQAAGLAAGRPAGKNPHQIAICAMNFLFSLALLPLLEG
jgi:hypothetical protein